MLRNGSGHTNAGSIDQYPAGAFDSVCAGRDMNQAFERRRVLCLLYEPALVSVSNNLKTHAGKEMPSHSRYTHIASTLMAAAESANTPAQMIAASFSDSALDETSSVEDEAGIFASLVSRQEHRNSSATSCPKATNRNIPAEKLDITAAATRATRGTSTRDTVIPTSAPAGVVPAKPTAAQIMRYHSARGADGNSELTSETPRAKAAKNLCARIARNRATN
jgi:hypothetical protein